MTEEEARPIYEQFCKQHGGDLKIKGTAQQDGSWLFIVRQGLDSNSEYVGVVVRSDKRVFGFYGALGKVFRNYPALGLPTSNELVLGAMGWGRYQAFDNGIAIWEGGKFNKRGDGEGNLAHPVQESMIQLPRQFCLVAFFDLRGFTSFSNKSSDNAYKVIRSFEEAVRSGFPTHGQQWLRQFVKGTGDGVMIVSQADWYNDDENNTPMTSVKSGHAKDFLQACERTLSEGRKNLKEFSLPIGCAIGAGELDRVFLFGRLDYIGPVANEVAKLQQHARDEICVTEKFRGLLEKDGENLERLSAMGWRLRSS